MPKMKSISTWFETNIVNSSGLNQLQSPRAPACRLLFIITSSIINATPVVLATGAHKSLPNRVALLLSHSPLISYVTGTNLNLFWKFVYGLTPRSGCWPNKVRDTGEHEADVSPFVSMVAGAWRIVDDGVNNRWTGKLKRKIQGHNQIFFRPFPSFPFPFLPLPFSSLSPPGSNSSNPFLVYLEPRNVSWWLQMSYFYLTKSRYWGKCGRSWMHCMLQSV